MSPPSSTDHSSHSSTSYGHSPNPSSSSNQPQPIDPTRLSIATGGLSPSSSLSRSAITRSSSVSSSTTAASLSPPSATVDDSHTLPDYKGHRRSQPSGASSFTLLEPPASDDDGRKRSGSFSSWLKKPPPSYEGHGTVPRVPSPGPTPQESDEQGLSNSNEDLRSGGGGGGPAVVPIASMGRTNTETSRLSRRSKKPPSRREPTNKESFMAALKLNWLNLLLLFIPVSWAANFAHLNDTIIFVTAFLAIVPLASLLGFTTEELEKRVGPTLGGLVNATLGNVVELLIAILALAKCELQVVQTSLLGSILSNLLLVLGTCFALGGINFSHLSFKSQAARLSGSILFLAVGAVLLPTTFHATFGPEVRDSIEQPDLLKVSRGTSILLLLIYGGYLLTQMFTHKYLYDATPDEEAGPSEEGIKLRFPGKGNRTWTIMKPPPKKDLKPTFGTPGNLMVPMIGVQGPPSRPESIEAARPLHDQIDEEDDDDDEKPELNKLSILILMGAIAAVTGVTSEFLVDALDGFATDAGLSREFIGVILLPVIGNAAEHVSAVTAAMKGKAELALGIAVGSAIQISVFVLPLLIIIGWMIGKDLSMTFTAFEGLVLFISVLSVVNIINGGRATFLSGWSLIIIYTIVALTFYFYPGDIDNFFPCT